VLTKSYNIDVRRAIFIFLALAIPAYFWHSDQRLDLPVWKSRTLDGDSLFFIKEEGQQLASASLLYAPSSMPKLRSATGEVQYQPNGDFIWTPGSRRIERTLNSRIPFRTRAEMYPILDGRNEFAKSSSHPGRALLAAEGSFFHDLQVVAQYRTDEHWTGFVPKTALGLLPRTRALLRDKRPLHLAVLGDSISTGANASGIVGARPYIPGYPDAVARGLEARGASKVTLTNLSAGGTMSSWGVTRIPEVVAAMPDLLIIAFGMNDASSKQVTPAQYAQNTREMIETTISELPQCEIILVAPMIGNPEWYNTDEARLLALRDELLRLEATGVAVADVTSFWAELLKRKKLYDLTGNGLNHPNDFGHKVYAQVILEAVGP
jgi:lysophospholipase L1-like esterase